MEIREDAPRPSPPSRAPRRRRRRGPGRRAAGRCGASPAPAGRGAIGALFAAGALLAAPAAGARDPAPGFQQQSLDLPGVPAAMVPADLDRDGHDDLVVLVAYTGWRTRSEFAPAKFDDVEGLVEVMSVVDELVERRELRLYPSLGEGGGFGSQLAAVELDRSVHALAGGHPAEPLIAVTDGGAAAVRLRQAEEGPGLSLTPLVTRATSFAGSGRFYPELELMRDLDGDGLPELLLPTAEGWLVYRGVEDGLEAEPASLIELPEPALEGEAEAEDDDGEPGPRAERGGEATAASPAVSDSGEEGDGEPRDEEDRESTPAHELDFALEDCDGDGRLDFVVTPGDRDRDGPLIYRAREGLAFAPPVELLPAGRGEEETEVMLVGDLDGDERAETVERTAIERYEDPGWRQQVDEAKRPLFAYAVRELGPDLAASKPPRRQFRAIGYTFGGSEGDDEEEIRLPGGFKDLDGDGRQDLVAITLEFSVLPLAMRVLVVRRIALTMNFHLFCQSDDGSFSEVPGLDLSGRFRLDLNNLRVRHLSQFAGDFDGDGRADFVQLGRGREVTIHRGRSGCRYPALADRTIRLRRKLRHLGLARVADLDGDGRSDLYVVHPLKRPDRESSIPSRVDLYLSRF